MPKPGQSAPRVSSLPINEKWDEKKINKLESGDGTLIICKFSERERDKRNMLPKAKADCITKYLLHFCCKFEQL